MNNYKPHDTFGVSTLNPTYTPAKVNIMSDETILPAKKRGSFFYRKPEIDETRKIEIVRQDSHGNEIRKTCGSIGFQVFVDAKFKTFVTGLEEANNVLDALILAKK